LFDGVKCDGTGAFKYILITQITSWHTRLIGAEVAVIFTTELIRGKTDAYIENSTGTADGLFNEGTIEVFIIGHEAMFHIGTVYKSKLGLGWHLPMFFGELLECTM
jgi:hypothetical protein